MRETRKVVLAMMADSTAGVLDDDYAATDDMDDIKADSGDKQLSDYMIGLDADGKIKSGCTYAFTQDGTVTQTLPSIGRLRGCILSRYFCIKGLTKG